MDIQDIYTTSNYIANKHKSGNAFTPNQFNALVHLLNRDYFKKKVEESGYFDSSALSFSDSLRGSKDLHTFIVNEVIASGGSASYTFAYPLGASDNDTDVLVEFVSEAEYHDRLGDSVMTPSASAPIALERGGNIDVEPNSTANLNLSYYRFPSTPFLDYYISVTGIIQFLGAGITHTWTTAEIDSSGTVHTTGDADWSSLTVELEYNEDMHQDFLSEILSRVGIRLKELELTKYAETMKAEQKSM